MGRVSASLHLDRDAETVFRVATRVADMPRWLPEVVSASLPDGTLAPGARVELVMSPAVGGTRVVGTVTDLRPPALLGIRGSAGPLELRVRTALDALAQGATRIRLEIEVSAPPLLGFIAREAERRIQAELAASLQRFAALVAAEPA